MSHPSVDPHDGLPVSQVGKDECLESCGPRKGERAGAFMARSEPRSGVQAHHIACVEQSQSAPGGTIESFGMGAIPLSGLGSGFIQNSVASRDDPLDGPHALDSLKSPAGRERRWVCGVYSRNALNNVHCREMGTVRWSARQKHRQCPCVQAACREYRHRREEI